MAGNMKVSHQILLGLRLIYCLGFLMISVPQAEAPGRQFAR